MSKRNKPDCSCGRNGYSSRSRSAEVSQDIHRSFSSFLSRLYNSYTIGCPHVRGANPRALASGLSYVQEDKHGILFYTTYISVDLSHDEIFRAKVGKSGIRRNTFTFGRYDRERLLKIETQTAADITGSMSSKGKCNVRWLSVTQNPLSMKLSGSLVMSH